MYVISFTMTGTSWKCVRDWQEQAEMLAENLSGQLFQNPKYPRVILITATIDVEDETIDQCIDQFVESVPTPHIIFSMKHPAVGETTGGVCGACLGIIFHDANADVRHSKKYRPMHSSPETKRRS